MAINRNPIHAPVYDGYEQVKAECLRKPGSLFSPGRAVWTLEHIESIRRRFNENPDESTASFVEKLTLQMETASDDEFQLFAELLWLHFSCSGDVSGEKKREHINRLLGWMKSPAVMPTGLSEALEHGMASTGVAFNTYRAQQLWFLIDFIRAWRRLEPSTVRSLLNDPWAFKSFLFDIPIEAAFIQRNALLHVIHPSTFQDIYSRSNKAQIFKAFAEFMPNDVTDVDRGLMLARKHVVETYPEPSDESRYWCPFYWEGVREKWDKNHKERQHGADYIYEPAKDGQRVWLFSPGRQAFDWERQRNAGIMCIGWDKLGDLSRFTTKAEVEDAVDALYRTSERNPFNSRRAMVDTRFRVHPGDIVIAKKGRTRLLGAGVIKAPYQFVPHDTNLSHQFKVDWFHHGEWSTGEALSLKTLTDISRYHDFVNDLFSTMGLAPEDIPIHDANATDHESSDEEKEFAAYGLTDAQADLFVDETDLTTMVDLLKTKKNLVLTGPPGTGKTFLAARLGYLLAQEKNPDRICRIQFHQSMAYEDFVQGYRPSGDGFQRRNGPFVQFCRQAAQDDRPHVLLIDEINRGNLSRIFGELMLLIEHDKRSPEWATRLAYATDEDKPFWVPENVYIVGTMNTADRSLALVDYALRRRFAFWSVKPAFDHEGLHRHLEQNGMSTAAVERVVGALHALNGRIRADPNLGVGFCIGHSYFCDLDGSRASLSRLIKTELAPLLREYWFDDPGRANEEIRELERVV